MRIHVVSDLHQEFGEVAVSRVDCDCVICAGDVSNNTQGLKWIRKNFPDGPVIYICGNHEFYGAKLPKVTELLREEARGTNVHFLENESVTIGGIHFFGCTLWTDLALQGDWQAGEAEVKSAMNDYSRIRSSAHGFRRLLPRDTRLLHQGSMEALRGFLATHDPRNSVVVSHHAPSALSLPERYRDSLVNCAYASRLDDFILEHQPRLWIHGHIHRHNDYHIGRTRILANPRGYPTEPDSEYLADLVVDLEPAGLGTENSDA